MRSWLCRFWPALALAALALALRCYGLMAPLLDYHSWRQADTAAIARNYAANGYRLPYPQVDWGGQTPGYVESEFPLYTYTLALLYGMFGVHEWLGRLATALAGAGAAATLAGMAAAHIGSRAALYGGLALALMPFPIYFGRAVMPDTWMLLAAILAIWCFRRWIERPSAGRYAAALLFGSLAPLAKTPNLLIVAVPVAYMALADQLQRPRRPRAIGWLAIYSVCFVVPSLVWLRHARALPLDPRLSFGIGEKLFDLSLLLDPQFYLLLARWSIENVLTLAGLPFFLIGIGPSRWFIGRSQSQHATDHTRQATEHGASFNLLPHFWLLGVMLFFCAGAAGVVGQDYYILPLAGPAAWFVGVGMVRAQRFLEKIDDRRWAKASRPSFISRPSSSVFGPIVAAVALVALAALSLSRVAPLYQTTDFYRTLGRRVDLALPAGARVGMIAPAVSEILYYGARQGWRLDPGVLVPGGLASLPPDLGVRYLLVADPALTERRELLAAALREYHRIPVGPYALLLDLAKPGLQRPATLVWQTGYLVEEPFLSYWQKSGGAERLGYPLSDALAGPEGREQYFERALLLQNGERVKRLSIGRLLLEAQGRLPQPAEVAASFRAAWEQAGGEKALGMALSPIFDTGDRQIQYFEFGTLELTPGGVPGVGAAGRQLLAARGLTEERQIEQLRGW
jgi:4-amino-4-deoxy-L-arabinose transferase-like glycosyltransferase